MEKITNMVIHIRTVAVFLLLGALCITNIYNFEGILRGKVDEHTGITIDVSDVEDTFRESIVGRNTLVDVYGVYQKALDHNIVGNFEYVADEYGIMHMINDYNPYQTESFIQEMGELYQYTEEKNIPLIYVQAPNREIVNQETAIDAFNLDDETMDEVVLGVKDLGITVLDLRENLQDENLELTDIYFHTDLHMQTDAEIWMATKVAEYLNEQGITIENMEYLKDLSNYEKKSYDFVGNYGRTNGKLFVEADVFDIYHPRFETLYTFEVPGAKETIREGTFEEIVLNGYEDSEYDEYTYWVTDFMGFTQPYYSITNQNQEDVKLLVITDSIAYRGLAYLSLTTQEITILDPRFFGETDYIPMALEEDYDAVIVWQGNYLIGYELLHSSLENE